MLSRPRLYRQFVIALVFVLGWTKAARALPFNDDMVHDQYSVNEVMRGLPKDSVPLGSNNFYLESREAAEELENPIKGDHLSTLNGERLWAVNCSMCHGLYTPSGYKAGVVNQFMPGPDLNNDFYKSKSDGHFLAYIHFGGIALMPRYGWKLSETEHWDLVNYIRKIQGLNK